MKARDIIPGWPRGRSSSKPYFGMLPTWLYRFNGPGIWDPDIELYLACLEADTVYHEAQQKMVDDFRREHSAAIHGFVMVNDEVVGTVKSFHINMDVFREIFPEMCR